MLKKILILFIAFIGTFSVGYAYYNLSLNAAETMYQSGGFVTGRIGPAGGNNFIKGDRVITDVSFRGTKIDWLIMSNSSQWGSDAVSDNIGLGNNGVFAMSYNQITNVRFRDDISSGEFHAQLSTSNLPSIYTEFNQAIEDNERQKQYVLEHTISQFFVASTNQPVNGDYVAVGEQNNHMAIKYAFPMAHHEIDTKDHGVAGRYGSLENYDRAYTMPYMVGSVNTNGYMTSLGNYITESGAFAQFSTDPSGDNISWFTEMPLRIPIAFNFSNVVFAVSDPYGSDTGGLSEVENVDQIGACGTLYERASNYQPMKFRLRDDTNLGVSFDKITLETDANKEISTVKAGKNIKLFWSNKRSPTNNDYVSVLIEKKNSSAKYDFVYYGNLSKDTSGSFVINTSMLTLGEYRISIVDETISETQAVTYSSSMKSKNITIIEPLLHSINYRKETTTESKYDYEFGKNVNANDIIGKITLTPTATTIFPVTYELLSDGDDSYKNFNISGLDSINSSSSTTLNVMIKADAPDLTRDGLKAGTYKFCITSQDADGIPAEPILNKTKVCTALSVEKADLSVAFDAPNQTKKTIDEAGTNWSEPATVTPRDGTKITYTIVGGDIGLIDIDEDTGEVTYKGNGDFGKVKIRATVDDDPNTGNDNYNPAYTEKEIVIVREVDAAITPDPASSNTSIPSFSMDQINIKAGGTIGKIQGILGTPDTIGESTTTYSYQIKAGGNASFFKVNSGTGVIQTNANLAVGTYTFEITVSDKWSSKDITVKVNVGMSPAEELKFYENSSSDIIITKKNAKVTDTGITVFATVKGSSNHNPVTYKLKDGEPANVIDVNPNSGAVTIKNVGKVIVVAEKQGATGQANAYAELEFTVIAGSQEFIYVDESGNELPKTLDKYQTYEEVYGKDKKFKVHTDGNPAGTNVTYELKNTSPTDVITVDEDGTIHILNASLNKQKGQVIVVATSHDPNGNYEDKTIELPIDITKADQKISFADVTHAPNGSGRVTPLITEQDLSGNAGGANVEDPDYYISVGQAGNGIAWTNNGVDIEYNYDEEEGIIIPLHVEKEGNRNYNKAEADGTLKILGQEESTLAINQPGKVVYGDHFTIRSLQDDSSSTNVKYTFEVDNTIYISQPNINGNKAEFDALKNSGNTEIEIKVTRTADGEVALSKTIKIKVLPKDIEIIIDDKQKKQGEENPELTFQDFQDQLVSWNGVKDQVDSNDVKLTTTATTTSKGGSYPITGNPKTMNGKYPNYNFIFTDGKLMIEGLIDKDVDDDGEPDFNDPDGDGCPDLNIKWKDDDENWVIINGDRDYDGIPDLNIDSDGDGIPNLNIDTDKDGKPDINLVILTKAQWKPSKCVVVSDIVKVEYCTGTNVKPQINVDTDNDGIPNINIDNEGDFKRHLNISKDGKTPTVNITNVHEWNPSKDYKSGKFTYDSIGKEIEPQINIDTNGDDCPDINLDMDNDGIPDLNIDTDGDKIPDLNIDTVGDGKADANVDIDDDGMPDENIIEITEWKPDKKVGNICTMIIKQNTELEDNGVKVEKPDGTPFLPNYALKVNDVTNMKHSEITDEAKEFIEEIQEVKKVYEVKLLKDDVEVQPDGILKVKIPYEGVKNPILIKRLKDGSYEKIEYKIEKGYLVYETEELGIVSIIGDKEFDTSVQGTYTPNIGGAITGDETNIYYYIGMMFITLGFISYLLFKRNKQKDTF